MEFLFLRISSTLVRLQQRLLPLALWRTWNLPQESQRPHSLQDIVSKDRANQRRKKDHLGVSKEPGDRAQ